MPSPQTAKHFLNSNRSVRRLGDECAGFLDEGTNDQRSAAQEGKCGSKLAARRHRLRQLDFLVRKRFENRRWQRRRTHFEKLALSHFAPPSLLARCTDGFATVPANSPAAARRLNSAMPSRVM